MAAKNYWTSKEGKAATSAAAQADAAGAMRVSPGVRNTGRPTLGNTQRGSLPETVAVKNYWTSKEGKAATGAAAQADAAGAMRVSPGVRNTGRPTLGNTQRGSLPETVAVGGGMTLGKQLSSSGTGYGSFRNTPTTGTLMGGGGALVGGRAEINDQNYTKER